jgi:hypothetical protein
LNLDLFGLCSLILSHGSEQSCCSFQFFHRKYG